MEVPGIRICCNGCMQSWRDSTNDKPVLVKHSDDCKQYKAGAVIDYF